MTERFYPDRFIKQVFGSDYWTEKLITGQMTFKQAAMQAVLKATGLNRREVNETVYKVLNEYQEKTRDYTAARWQKGEMDRIYLNVSGVEKGVKVYFWHDKDGKIRRKYETGIYSRSEIPRRQWDRLEKAADNFEVYHVKDEKGNYREARWDDLLDKLQLVQNEREEIADEKLLKQRLQGLVLYNEVERQKEEHAGEYYRWLPSESKVPDPEHQLLYGKIFKVGEGDKNGNMPCERYGCKCGIEWLTPDEVAKLKKRKE